MTFFYDLNKRLANLASKQDAQQLAEHSVPASKPPKKSPLAQALVESEKWIQKAVNPKTKGNLHKALHVPQGETIPKDKIAKATHSKNPKLRHMAQFAKNVAKEGEEQGGDVMDYLNHELKDYDAQQPTKKGNAFSGAVSKAKAQHKDEFEVDGKKYKVVEADPTGLGEDEEMPMDEGYAEMDAWLKSREKEKGTGKFDRKERTLPGGMKATTYTRKSEEDAEDDDAEITTITIKKKGRPAGTKRKIGAKHSGRSKLASKDAIAETDMEGNNDYEEAGEFGAEGDYVKNELHTMVRVARDLEKHLRDNEDLPTWCIGKLSQAKGMVVSVMDYIMSEKERGIEADTGREGITLEKAPPGAKAERMVKGIKKSLSKDGNLSNKDKAIAYATTWKAKKAGKVEEESTDKEDRHAEKAGEEVTKDVEYKKGHKAKADPKAERDGEEVTHDIEYDDKKDRKEKKTKSAKPDFLDVDKDGNKKEPFKKAVKDKEEKVDETTTSGSVATSTETPKAGKGGMSFGKGVYESLNKQFAQALTESISVQENVEECGMEGGQPSITITADGEDAAKLMMLLKLAGLEGKQPCPQCGNSPCGCAEVVDENSPDWPTNTETKDADPNLRTYSGGLNGPKSTGQTTTPVIAGQLRRQASMEEGVKLERSLFNTWKNYKG